ncbi:ACS family glucarate transporter-like MFS transporter [Paraburkholderia unamae]|uniref:MFS transporter n=1 Tax=Paraburkholderia unamae TaxID=219649 RepID=UPI000DC35FBC|nr:MFS transporter [Paraburkholderia unamae]RAR47908.1 ACS family glucarate transporter-like MFS transporter [Paraburkholderia unamae]
MSYRRGWIAVFLFSLSMINYMDRIALSIAAKPIQHEFGLSPVGMGYLFSSFIWSYALFLLPMGFLVDRLGAKRMAALGILVWSTATALTGAATNFATLIAARLVMGAGESTSNPVGGKVIRQWIPASERGMVSAMFNSGSYAGPAICSVMLGTLVALFGWRVSFVIAGAIGFVWLGAWLLFFNSPERVRWLKTDEREKIIRERESKRAVGDDEDTSTKHGFQTLVRSRTLWGLALTQGCNVYTQYLFLTWLPSYLQTTRHLSLAHTGVLAAVPYAAAVLLCILVGRFSDQRLKKVGVGTGQRRKAVALAMLTGSAILAVPFTSNLGVLLLIFSIALAGIASTTSLNYALLNDLLPSSKHIAKAMAFIVVGGNTFGMIAPIATGYVIQATGRYDWAFGIAGLLLLFGASVVMTMTRAPIVSVESETPSAVSAQS